MADKRHSDRFFTFKKEAPEGIVIMARKIEDKMHRQYRIKRRTNNWFLNYLYDGMAFVRLNPEE